MRRMAYRVSRLLVFMVALVPSAATAQDAEDPSTSGDGAGRSEQLGQSTNSQFGRDTWNVELAGQFLVEAWDLNHSKESLVGGTAALGYALADDWAVNAEVSFLRVGQDTSYDVLLPAVSGIVRWRAHQSGPVSVFVEGGPGISYATDEVPETGTRFNFVAQLGGGMAYRIASSFSLVGGLRWLHLSNNSLNGRRSNPDIQALGMYLGWIVH